MIDFKTPSAKYAAYALNNMRASKTWGMPIVGGVLVVAMERAYEMGMRQMSELAVNEAFKSHIEKGEYEKYGANLWIKRNTETFEVTVCVEEKKPGHKLRSTSVTISAAKLVDGMLKSGIIRREDFK